MFGFLTFAFLFFVGSVSGWILEVIFRSFISSGNPEHKLINPGFCTGPYLPIYGFGLCLLYLLANLEQLHLIENHYLNMELILLAMGGCMTTIEYIAGIISLRYANVRLWDYSEEWGNIQGIVCPKFSLMWTILGGVYYFLIHPHIQKALAWLSGNLAFSFVLGLFFGIFLIDAAHSAQLTVKLKAYAQENNVVVRYEAIKAAIRQKRLRAKKKYSYFFPLHTEHPLSEYLSDIKETFEKK